jgi:thiol:disulfide interchange protein
MPKSLTALSARLGFVVVAVSLTVAACSIGGSKPVTSVTATPLVTTAIPEVTASRPIPSPSPTVATIHLPQDFDPTRAAWRDINEALKKAAVDHKPVLIDFWASWCPGCTELEQSFQAPQVQAMVQPLHRVRVDTGPRMAAINLDVAAAYGLDLTKTGLPGLVLLSPLGKAEATTNDGLFDNNRPNSPSEISGFLKPHL